MESGNTDKLLSLTSTSSVRHTERINISVVRCERGKENRSSICTNLKANQLAVFLPCGDTTRERYYYVLTLQNNTTVLDIKEALF